VTGALPVIWIVDDDASVRRAMRRLMDSLSFGSEAFSSGEEVLDRLQTDVPSCILLDVHMPTLSGVEVLKSIRALGLDVPTILMTGVLREGTREDGLSAGAVEVLAKPVSSARLLSILKTCGGLQQSGLP
jgi:FixJ family two-component response regulator